MRVCRHTFEQRQRPKDLGNPAMGQMSGLKKAAGPWLFRVYRVDRGYRLHYWLFRVYRMYIGYIGGEILPSFQGLNLHYCHNFFSVHI